MWGRAAFKEFRLLWLMRVTRWYELAERERVGLWRKSEFALPFRQKFMGGVSELLARRRYEPSLKVCRSNGHLPPPPSYAEMPD